MSAKLPIQSPQDATVSKPWEDLVLQAPRPDRPPTPQETARKDLSQMNASYLTHELRAPLTSIRSALALLQEKLGARTTDDERQLLALALKNSDRLEALINDVMDYSKIRAGKLSMRPEPVYPKTLIQEAVDGLKAWAVSKGVRLIKTPEEEPLPRVRADSGRVVQVLVNLLSNAIKFTNPGGRVEVTAKPGKHEHRGTIVFSVRDTGCGISGQDREKIFNAFEQSARGEKVSNGAGLGLTLAKAMVGLHGGRIWVESWKGLGSTFRFTIPIAPEDLPQPIAVYPKPVEYHGLLVHFARRLNAVLALFSI